MDLSVQISLGQLLKRAISVHSSAGQIILPQTNESKIDRIESGNVKHEMHMKSRNKTSNRITTPSPNKFTVGLNECISKSVVPHNRYLSFFDNIILVILKTSESLRKCPAVCRFFQML